MDYAKKLTPKDIICLACEIVFWAIIFVILLINFYSAGSIFTYGEVHDHHLAFFAYLGGMASNGIFPGIDFYSPHSIFIPIAFGIFFAIFGVTQIHLGMIDGFFIFITMIFVYKSARLVLPSMWAKLAIVILLLSHSGRDNPWFNDVLMMCAAIGVYYFVLYIRTRKLYTLNIVGIICFILPYMRQQGLVIDVVFLVLPIMLYYMHFIEKHEYIAMMKRIVITFLCANAAFLLFVFLRNGIEGLEILYSSLTTLVAMSQPAIGYENGILTIASYIFDYTAQGLDWHGYFTRFLSYWFIVIIPALYFAYRPISTALGKNMVDSDDIIRFVVALVTLSTIVFNYPINEDARMRVQFGIGIWLFVDAIRTCFYNKNAKIFSLFAIAVVVLLINHSKLYEFIERSVQNCKNITMVKDGFIKMPSHNPYEGMKFREQYAQNLSSIISSLQDYAQEHPDKEIIFDGELVNINAYLFLLFTEPKIALQHKFPYYYGSTFNRIEYFEDMEARYNEFVESHKHIIIACEDINNGINSAEWIQNAHYRVLNRINEQCNILVPQESTQTTQTKDKND